MYQSEISTENRMAWDASTEAAYWQLREQEARSEVAEISLMEFMDAIAVMYPKDWAGDAHSETFKLAEMYCGEVTTVYAKVGERYFRFRDVVTLPHSAILARINKEVLSRETQTRK
ncbi:hypothetical protein I5K96_24030 [Serratia marcescens]|uniref:hypothetical protein n=1 Tax=Serratia TaxID=613 RepID=UPI0018D93EB3|nr:hypothetical protein [Serratia marcescens]MBH2524407.1 hypothetical protein [Serratia marcescens]MBH2894523.1 hypothetical protein [Serratia marcescens]MBH2909063.1 hypothetical protein [Serratia marcescens]MBH2913743.1 hypothetical protein [Serratia marcescens]CAI1910251.1 Uncharacterised protein [Serratia marcescens]